MTLDDILVEMKQAEKIVVMAHETPDGDAIGSMLSMKLALKKMGKEADVIVKEFPRTFSFLPGANDVKTNSDIETYDLAISLDCADLKRLVEELGYKMDCKVQIASEHGVLQDRHRVIIVGWKDNQFKGYSYPILEKESMSYAVMKDLFSDLPLRKAGEGNLCGIVSYTKPLSEMQYLKESGIRGVLDFTTQHVARPTNANDRQIYKIAVDLWLKNKQRLNYAKLPIQLQTHNNKKAFLNRFNVVNPFGCCHTVVAHIAMDGHYYIYPTPNPTIDTVRSITVREAARLQSFPDDYFFEGSRTAVLRQIGNAVPVVLAYKIAEEIKKILL